MWLHWEDCTQDPTVCEARIGWRYQFRDPSSFKFEVRPCQAGPCPTWTAWEATSESCRSSCTKLWQRHCFTEREGNVPSNRCKPQSIAGRFNNNTHLLLPCVGLTCPVVRRIDYPIQRAPSDYFTPPPFEVPIPTEPPEVDCLLDGEAEEQSASVFSTSGFWVGFCVGAVVIVAIFVFIGLVYCQTRKGRVTIAAIKTYRENEKRYFERKRRNNNVPLQTIDSTPTNQSRTPHNRSRNERDFDAKTIESMSSYPSWRRDEGYRSNPNTGSISGNSKYQESLNVSGPSYGPFYTPSGESKLLSPNRRPLPVPIVQDLKRGALNSDSDSDSSYDPPHPPHWDDSESPTASINLRNGAFYYEKHFNSQGRQKGDFNEEAYMRSYRRYRARKKRRSSIEKPPLDDGPQSPAESSKADSLFEKATSRPSEKAMISSNSDNIEIDIAEHLQVELPKEEEVTQISDAETQRWVSDAEKSRPTTITDSLGHQSDTDLPQWTSDADKLLGTNNVESFSRSSDNESHRWTSDAERSLALERVGRLMDSESRPSTRMGAVSDAESYPSTRMGAISDTESRLSTRTGAISDAESQASSQHWASDAERSRYNQGPVRRLAEAGRQRWGSDTDKLRRTSNGRTRRTSEKQHRTTERGYRTAGERTRRASAERLHRTTERPRRQSEERSYNSTAERPRRTSAERQGRPSDERSRWQSNERIHKIREEQSRRTPAETSRQAANRALGPSTERDRGAAEAARSRGIPAERGRGLSNVERSHSITSNRSRGISDAERTRGIPTELNRGLSDVGRLRSIPADRSRGISDAERPRAIPTDRSRGLSNAERSRTPPRRVEGSRYPEEAPHDYRYAKLQKRPAEDANPRSNADERYKDTRRFEGRNNLPSRGRSQNALDFPPPPAGF